jgi:hypothetical protein
MKNKVKIVVSDEGNISSFKSLSINGFVVNNVKSYSVESCTGGLNVVRLEFYCDDVEINRDKNDLS